MPLGGEYKTWQLDCYVFNFEILLVHLAKCQEKVFQSLKMHWLLSLVASFNLGLNQETTTARLIATGHRRTKEENSRRDCVVLMLNK